MRGELYAYRPPVVTGTHCPGPPTVDDPIELALEEGGVEQRCAQQVAGGLGVYKLVDSIPTADWCVTGNGCLVTPNLACTTCCARGTRRPSVSQHVVQCLKLFMSHWQA